MEKKSVRLARLRNGSHRRWSVSASIALALAGLAPFAADAYTAAGDRNFPANIILPQPGPSDAVWGYVSTQPMATTETENTVREAEFTGTYSKLITERLGIQFEDGLALLDRLHAPSVAGAQNLHLLLQYEAAISQPHEFVLSLQVDHEFGGTGSQRVESSPQSATTPGVTFAKGLGDLPIGYWRPLAITGFAGYQAAQGSRTNTVQAGFSIQYSMPYLLSKVADVNLPTFLRRMTPMTEVLFTTPTGRRYGQGTTVLVAPGVNYSQGQGWEVGIEAMIPTTKATGTGVGFIAQFVLQLDYLLPDTVFGRPLFPRP